MRSPRHLVLPLIASLVLAWIACPCLWSRMLGVAEADAAVSSGVDGQDAPPVKRCSCCSDRTPNGDGDPDPDGRCGCSRRGEDNATTPDGALDLGSAELVEALDYALPTRAALGALDEKATAGRYGPRPPPRPRPIDVRRGIVLLR